MQNKIFFMTYAYGEEIGVIEFDDMYVAYDAKDSYGVSGYSTVVRSYDVNDPVVVELRKHLNYKIG